jgi:hypothetical protein
VPGPTEVFTTGAQIVGEYLIGAGRLVAVDRDRGYRGPGDGVAAASEIASRNGAGRLARSLAITVARSLG